MKRRNVLIALLLAVTMIVGYMPVASADQVDPDSTPTVNSIYFYRNLLETGDRFLIFSATIPYGSTPNATMPEAFIWQLIHTDGVTVLGQTTGYAYNDSGYGQNIFGMYWSAADALAWSQLYTIKLVGNPAIFDVPKEYNYPVALGDYTTLTSQVDNQAALAALILSYASDLDIAWGLTTSYSLLYESESGTCLSIYGEAFFRGAIYGVQALAPLAFRLVVVDVTAEDRTWTTGFAENLSTQYAGTWIQATKTGGGTMFGLGYDLMSIIITVLMCIGVIVLNLYISRDNWNALIDVAIILVIAPAIDLIPLSFTALVCSIFVMYEGTKVKSFVR